MGSQQMTTANKVTILRILLIPFFVIEMLYYVKTGDSLHRVIGIVCFTVAVVCDGVDGYIARRFNQRSELGAILDPLADKLLLVSAIVLLSFDHEPYLDMVPLWLTGIVIGRDILLLIGLLVIQFTVGKVKARPRMVGKISTVLQMVVVLWILLRFDDQWLVVWTVSAAAFTAISGLWYVSDGVRVLSAHPISLPTPIEPEQGLEPGGGSANPDAKQRDL